MEITTKFAIATDEGTHIMLDLARKLAREKFAPFLDHKALQDYLDRHFNEKQLVAEMNDLSNQWLLAYTGNIPVGYAKITSKGKIPAVLANKRAARIADFAILETCSEPEMKNSLLEKCLSVCRHHDGIWINDCLPDPMTGWFESRGFRRQPDHWQHDDVGLPSVCLVCINNDFDTKKI